MVGRVGGHAFRQPIATHEWLLSCKAVVTACFPLPRGAAVPRLEKQGVTELAVPFSGKGAQEPAKPQQTINAAASHRAQEYVAALQQEQQAKKKKAAAADPGWTQVRVKGNDALTIN